MTESKRITHSLSQSHANKLARHALNMSEILGRVSRQDILEKLVEALSEKSTYDKVFKAIKKSNGANNSDN
jgi:glutamate mutase epsilon subunit